MCFDSVERSLVLLPHPPGNQNRSFSVLIKQVEELLLLLGGSGGRVSESGSQPVEILTEVHDVVVMSSSVVSPASPPVLV